MIGAILSMKYIGKKSWIQSVIFWVGYIIIAMIANTMLSSSGMYIGLLVSVAAFVLLAHYWYKFNWEMSFKLFVVAFIIDIIIVMIIVALIGVTFIDLIPGSVILSNL